MALSPREIADRVLSGLPISAEEAAGSDGSVEMKVCEKCGRSFARAAIGPKAQRKRDCPRCL